MQWISIVSPEWNEGWDHKKGMVKAKEVFLLPSYRCFPPNCL
jgi:hypothetical protein